MADKEKDPRQAEGGRRRTASMRDALSQVRPEEAPAGRPATAAEEPPRPAYAPAEPATADNKGGGALSAISIGGPSSLDRAIFCRQFATLSAVGIPVLKALKMMSERTPNARLRRAAAEEGIETHAHDAAIGDCR